MQMINPAKACELNKTKQSKNKEQNFQKINQSQGYLS
jgi:hypothetical protein